MRGTAVLLAIVLTWAMTNQAAALSKVALVIGNEAYTAVPRIDNPARDAQIVGAALQRAGFRLVGGHSQVDLDKAAMDQMVEDFGTMARDADIALFYYSGHGMQLDGKNYLLPINIESTKINPGTSSVVLGLHTLNADSVLKVMSDSGAHLKILLLDACRTPFIKGPSGLGPIEAPPEPEGGSESGTLIGFATQPNTTAWSGAAGDASPYAKALATYMKVRGLELFAMLNEVGLQVVRVTHHAQQPWVSNSPIEGKVYLNPPIAVAGIPTTPPELQGRSAPEPPPVPQVLVTTGKSLDFIERAYMQLENKDYVKARATLTQGIEVDQDFAPAFSYRGYAWYEEGLAERDPQSALVHYRQGFPDFDRAIRLDPSYAPVRRHRGNTIVATYRALKALGKPTNDILDRAVDDLKDAITLDPTSKTNANALGEAYLIRRSYRSAIQSFNQAIQRDSSYAAPYAGLCVAYRMLGDWETARRYAQLAADRDDELESKLCLRQPM
jgi:tetratricopeptide (TPR) repeat protein